MMQKPNQPQRGFTKQEYRQRISALQSVLQNRQIAVALLTSEPELRYFAGFNTEFWKSPTRCWYLIIPAEGQPVAVIPAIGEYLMRQGPIEDIRTWAAPDFMDEGLNTLFEVIAEIGSLAKIKNINLGVCKGAESYLRMPLDYFSQLTDSLKSSFSSVSWHNITPDIQAIRHIKSEAEIDKIRYAAQLASQAFASLGNNISNASNLSLADVFRAFQIELLKQGLDKVDYLSGGADFMGYADVISPANHEPLQNGQLLMMDTGALWDGYFCDFDRNYYIGKPTDKSYRTINDYYQRLITATQEASLEIKIGLSMSEVHQLLQTKLRKNGLDIDEDIGRCGHGLGIELTETPSIHPNDSHIVQQNMVLTLEPSITTQQGKMIVHEENIVIRNNHNNHNVEWLTQPAPNNLWCLS